MTADEFQKRLTELVEEARHTLPAKDILSLGTPILEAPYARVLIMKRLAIGPLRASRE